MEKMKRPTWDEYFMEMAELTAKRSTCMRRSVGAVIVKDKRAIATGYNGAARGDVNCIDTGVCHRCGHGHNDGDYGTCPAVHAEMNAMLSASRSEMIGATLYLAGVDLETGERIPPNEISPCPVCMRMIGNAGVDVVTGA